MTETQVDQKEKADEIYGLQKAEIQELINKPFSGRWFDRVFKLAFTKRHDNKATLEKPESVLVRKASLALDSETLVEALENGEVKQLSNGTYDFIALLGSTNSPWRQEGLERSLNLAHMNTYNPDMGYKWDPSFSEVEARAIKDAGVVGIRVENGPGITDGSLGSLCRNSFCSRKCCSSRTKNSCFF